MLSPGASSNSNLKSSCGVTHPNSGLKWSSRVKCRLIPAPNPVLACLLAFSWNRTKGSPEGTKQEGRKEGSFIIFMVFSRFHNHHHVSSCHVLSASFFSGCREVTDGMVFYAPMLRTLPFRGGQAKMLLQCISWRHMFSSLSRNCSWEAVPSPPPFITKKIHASICPHVPFFTLCPDYGSLLNMFHHMP